MRRTLSCTTKRAILPLPLVITTQWQAEDVKPRGELQPTNRTTYRGTQPFKVILTYCLGRVKKAK
jgi:hypothetical protein